MSAQIAADLRAAAEVLRRDGWTQGSYFRIGGGCCAEGAILRAAPGINRSNPCIATMIKHLGGGLIAWNDAAGRTPDEVIAALLAAADRAEAQR